MVGTLYQRAVVHHQADEQHSGRLLLPLPCGHIGGCCGVQQLNIEGWPPHEKYDPHHHYWWVGVNQLRGLAEDLRFLYLVEGLTEEEAAVVGGEDLTPGLRMVGGYPVTERTHRVLGRRPLTNSRLTYRRIAKHASGTLVIQSLNHDTRKDYHPTLNLIRGYNTYAILDMDSQLDEAALLVRDGWVPRREWVNPNTDNCLVLFYKAAQ